MTKLLNINELSYYFNVTTRTVYRWLEQGKLPPPTKKWGHKRWDPAKVQAALEAIDEKIVTNQDE